MSTLRLRLFTVPGMDLPAPYGGRSRQITVDIDPPACAARGLGPTGVLQALLSAIPLVPAGAAPIGDTEYAVTLNSNPETIAEFSRIPLRTVGGATVLLGDVAHVHDGYAVQKNVVRIDGRRAVYLSILRKADASTLDAVNAARELLPLIQATAPEGIEIKPEFDQSRFVRGAIAALVQEAVRRGEF